MNWDLTKLYNGFDDPNFDADWKAAEEALGQMEAFLKTISHEDEKAALKQAVVYLEKIHALFDKISHMIMLTLSTDSGNERAMGLQNKLQMVMMQANQLSSALSRYVGEIENVKALCESDEELKPFAYYFTLMEREAAHVLDPAIEPAVLKMQMSGGSAWRQLRNQVEGAHYVELEQDGEVKRLPLPAVRGMAYSADADLRKRAYEAELAAYPRMEIPMAACLNGIKGEAITMCSLRNYDSVLDTALESARMDKKTLDALLAAMRESLPMFRRYFRAKARALGHENGLPFYDLFAPMGKSARSYSLEEARALLVDVMGRFSDKMASFIDRAFAERWIDAFPYQGKRGGAFCAGVHPLGRSYILTNFDGSLNSVCTLAHELGHGYHGDCLKDNHILMCDYPMPLAETASIFNETLLTQKLMEQAEGDDLLLLLDQEVSDAAQVIVDILSRFIFESNMIEQRADHTLSARELKELMLDAQRQTYGDGLDPEYMHPYMWACKPHYYSTGLHFYNFPYAFGLLFGKGVYAIYQQRGEAFLPQYDQLLRETALADVVDVAASVGIDVTSVDFWRGSIKVIEEAVDKLCELLG